MKLKNILIVVDSIDKSKRFYTELFGLQVKADFGNNIMLTEGLVLQEKSSWEVLTNTGIHIGGCDAELYFEEAEMDRFLEKIAASEFEIEYLNPCTVNESGQRVVRFFDPDKHLIEVKEVVWGN